MQPRRAMAARDLRASTLVLIAICGGGCMTTIEGAQLTHEIAAIRPRLAELDRMEMERRQQTVDLQAVLDRATALLTSASADVGAKQAKAERDIAALESRVDEVTRELEQIVKRRAEAQNQVEIRIAALEQGAARIVDKVAPLLPDDKETLWSQAVERTRSGPPGQGRHFYRVFIQRFPADPRAAQCYLAIGQSFMKEKQYPNAAAEFQRLLATYPQAPEVPEAMWQLSIAFIELHFCADARSILGDLVKRFPKSSSAAEARQEIKSIKKFPKAACTS
jgi:TolA-binding protein